MTQNNYQKIIISLGLFFLSSFFTFPEISQAATYYVDINGVGVDGIFGNADDVVSNDSNPGTSEQPWKNIAKAQTSVLAGDTVNIRSGNYGDVIFNASGAKGVENNWIKYIGESGTIFRSLYFSQPSVWTDFYLQLENIHVKADYVPGTACSGVNIDGVVVENNCGAIVDIKGLIGYITLKNMEIEGFIGDDGYPGAMYGARFWYGDVSHVTLDGVDIHAVNGPILPWGGGGGNLGVDNKIINSKIHDSMGSAIKTFAGLDLIENNVIANEIPQAYNPGHPGGSGIALRQSNIIVRSNIILNWGMTRPIRWYQDTAGPDGYHDCIFENNLIYFSKGSENGFTYNQYVEIIDMGNNFVVRNNTFAGGAKFFLAQNSNGSGLLMKNNIFSILTLNNFYADSATLNAQSCLIANEKWVNVNEGNNIYGGLVASGGGYLCSYNEFSSTSNSVITNSFNALFVNSASPYFDYHLEENSIAINFGDATQQPSDSLGSVGSDGFLIANGQTRTQANHSAGAYEYIPSGDVTPPAAPTGLSVL